MKATFYSNSSDESYPIKSLKPIYQNIDIIYKEDTNLIKPTIITRASLITKAINYVWIDELKRFYFIRNYTFSQQRVFIDLEVDPLSTYWEDLKQREVILDRQQYINNRYQNDSEFPLLNMMNVRTIKFKNGFDDSGASFLLTLVGKSSEVKEE